MKPSMTADNLSDYNLMHDARFESMRDYPRKKQLYRKHVDIEKGYEKTVRHIKNYQRVILNECNRKTQKLDARFTKLIQHTFNSNRKKTSGLLYSYNKWVRKDNSRLGTSFDKMFDGNIQAMMSNNEFDKSDCETPIVTCDEAHEPKRMPSHRSVSMVNIPTEVRAGHQRRKSHVTVVGIGASCRDSQVDTEDGHGRQMTSISVCDLRTLSRRTGPETINVV